MVNLEYKKQLEEILNIYNEGEWNDEPLDGDEVDTLCDILKKQLNLMNGNITEEEYLEK